MVSGATTLVIISAATATVPASVAGGTAAALGGFYTFLMSNSCRAARELSGSELLTAINQLLAGG
jgi:hypothetical protein